MPSVGKGIGKQALSCTPLKNINALKNQLGKILEDIKKMTESTLPGIYLLK